MFTMYKPRRAAALCCAFVLMSGAALPMTAQDQSSPAPDNSTHNKAHNTTADQQSATMSDRDITKKIRRSIIADSSLSMYAHNVKIITQNGAVTLKGPVHSEEEKQTIASKAEEVAGKGKVTNQITIKQ